MTINMQTLTEKLDKVKKRIYNDGNRLQIKRNSTTDKLTQQLPWSTFTVVDIPFAFLSSTADSGKYCTQQQDTLNCQTDTIKNAAVRGDTLKIVNLNSTED